jgi:CheY-like chemotaxis protein
VQRTQEILERQTKHMAKLLDGLLDVSRIIRGRITIERATVDLVAVCREVLADLMARVTTRRMAFHAHLPSHPIWVEGDRVRLAQIVDNLLSNAVKYSTDGGLVTLELEARDGRARIKVRDSGVGIEPELLPHIFDVFRQAEQSLDRSHGGLGVGLALARSLAELHGGSIEARSEGAGRGAEFVVSLPLGAEPAARADAMCPDGGSGFSILLVEDNLDAAEMLRQVLELSGHRVWIASHGEQGLVLASEHVPDVVLCDLGLPGITGYEVADRLRANAETRSIRLVALSGYGRPEDKARCAAAGFDAHLTKPVDASTVERVVATLATAARAKR